MQHILRFKYGPVLPFLFVTSFWNFLVRVLCAALGENKHFVFFILYGDHTYHVRRTRYLRSSVRTAAVVVYSRYTDRSDIRKL